MSRYLLEHNERVTMGHSVVFLILLVVVTIQAFATGKPIFYNLTYSLFGITALSYIWAWYNLNWVDLERETLSAHAEVGKVAEERFLLRNTGRLPKLWLEVHDHSDLPDHHASMVVDSLGAGRHRGWSVRTVCRRRGRYRLGPITLISGDPFGLFVRRQRIDITSSVVVYPLMVDLPHFVELSGELAGGGRHHLRTHHVTTNVSGVREYYPGDTFNRIHWPSTARTGRLIVKEFELDPTADVWLFVDMDKAVQAERPPEDAPEIRPDLPVLPAWRPALDPSTEEYMVAVAASLARHFLERKRAVGLVAHSDHREMLQPDHSARHLTRILETLAVIRAHGHVNIAQLLAAEGMAFGRNSMAIVITPSTDTAWVDVLRDLDRRGVRGAGVIIDPSTFGAPRESTAVLRALARSGTPAYHVREGDSLAAALSVRAPI